MVSKEEIENLARLARLNLAPGEVETLQKDISGILDYVGQVSAVSGSQEKEVGLLHNVLREDTPRTVDSVLFEKRESLISAFPKEEKEYLVVRKIIEKDAPAQ